MWKLWLDSTDSGYSPLSVSYKQVNSLKPGGNSMHQPLQNSVDLHFVFIGFIQFSK